MNAYKLALGTAQFGLNYGIANQNGMVPVAEVEKILTEALAAKLNTLDTAISYGSSETSLGRIGVDAWDVVSKLPPLPGDCKNVIEWVVKQASDSLQMLKIKSLYGFLLHNPMQLLESQGHALADALCQLRSAKIVKKVGVSIYSPRELDEIYPIFRPDLVQAPLNLFDCRLIESGWLKRLADDGVEVHVRSVFLQGLLLMPQLPSRFLRWQPLWDQWQRWLGLHPGMAIAACLSYPMSFPQISKIIVGVDGLEQLRKLLATMGHLLSIDELPNLSCADEDLINPAKWKML